LKVSSENLKIISSNKQPTSIRCTITKRAPIQSCVSAHLLILLDLSTHIKFQSQITSSVFA